MNSLGHRPTVFVDTNTLHFMAHYLQVAEACSPTLPPYTCTLNDSTLEAFLTDSKPRGKEFPSGLVRSLRHGWRALAYLQSEVARGALVMASLLSDAELHRALLETRAQRQMLDAGMSVRMRQRTSDFERSVQMLLTLPDFRDAPKSLAHSRSMIEKAIGAELESANPQDFLDTIGFFELLQRRVYLDFVDCAILADALYHEADTLVTADGWLRDVVNLINNPNPKLHVRWHRLRRLLVRTVALTRGIPSSKVVIPKAPKLRSGVPNPIPVASGH